MAVVRGPVAEVHMPTPDAGTPPAAAGVSALRGGEFRPLGARGDMSPWSDPALHALVDHQGGVVSLVQLRALGVTTGRVKHAVRTGRLRPVHLGVYAVGRVPLGPRGRHFAAVLAAGDGLGGGAVIARRSAAAHHGLRPQDPDELVEVLVTRRCRQRTLRPVESRWHEDDLMSAGGLPVTTVARTLVDLADVLGDRALEHAYDTARVHRVLDPRALRAALDRGAGRRGAPRLRALVDADRPPALTNGPLEEEALQLFRAAGLPDPEVNVRVNGHLVDFAWRSKRLIVEVDGRATHGTARGQARDAARDADHRAAGWRVRRFPTDDVRRQPFRVVAVVAAELA